MLDYLWIVIAGGIASFTAAMGIGANDVANAYATSVGSKALTMNQAVVLAAVFETAGAVLMGSHVTNTIRKGIADYKCFEEQPELLMYGCMWVVLAVGAWLFLASYLEMPVSTTHSCVGSMIGMTLALKGPECVIWYEKKDSFPYIGGVSGIVLSWVISPLFSAILASLFFGGLRSGLLRLKNSFNRSIYVFPFITGSCVTLNAFYIIYKGAKGLGLNDTPFGIACAWSFGFGGGSGLLSLLLIKKAKVIVENRFKKSEANENAESVELELSDKKTTDSNVEDSEEFYNNAVNSSDVVLTIHENAEKFDEKTEELFKFLQIFI